MVKLQCYTYQSMRGREMRKRINRTSAYLMIVIIFLLVVNTTMGHILTTQSSEAMKELIHNRMLDISDTAAAMIDGDILRDIKAEDVNTPGYQDILKTLTYYQDNIDLKYIYCIRDMGDKNFVFTIDPTVEDPGVFGDPIVYTDALYEASLGKPSVDDEPYEDDWGRFYSAYTPVFDSDGKVAGIVAVDFDAEWYDKQISRQVRTTSIISIMSLTAGIVIVLMIAMRFSKRFRILYKELTTLSDDIEVLSKELASDSGMEWEGAKLLHEEEAKWGDPDDSLSAIGNKIQSLKEFLSQEIEIVKAKAYRDVLTGTENRMSYMEYIVELDEKIAKGDEEFAVAVFDINGLKNINDTQGHEMGDRAIHKAAWILRQVLKGEKLFRIGGDEFVAVLKADESRLKAIMEEVVTNTAKPCAANGDIAVTMSKGYAIYDKTKDKVFNDVFERADMSMYEDKKEFYKTHPDRRRS